MLVAAAKDTLENMPAVMNDKHAVIQSAEGRGRVGAQEFKKIMQVLKPDVLLSSSDELPAAGEFSRSRAVKSIKRTLEWTKEVWELEDTAVFAPVEGANFSDLRQLCVKEIRKDKLGMGVHISGIGFTESPQERKKLLELVCSAIAEEEHKAGDIVPVFVHANFGLVDILESVNVGVDLISTPYPAQLSTLGFALAIPESLLKGDSYVEETPALGTKINLRDRAYRLNGDRGIIENCTCACCKTYSKAYIQHLLNTHEMLAEVLLQV